MDIRERARALAEEHGMHAVVVLAEGSPDDDVNRRTVAEATEEVQAMAEGQGWPVWWLETADEGCMVVLDGLAMDIKAALVELEDSHPLGAWWNLDLVTVLPDGQVGEWHRSPMRPEPRTAPSPDELRRCLSQIRPA
ncbi:hypothetical protein [Luteococcus sp. OSA5]|uniref:hypothetical protein n=1 Tax=Luteococcus sp. OSA5 TaxID=3401630 RepID=UPI003B4283F4